MNQPLTPSTATAVGPRRGAARSGGGGGPELPRDLQELQEPGRALRDARLDLPEGPVHLEEAAAPQARQEPVAGFDLLEHFPHGAPHEVRPQVPLGRHALVARDGAAAWLRSETT